MVGGSRGLGSRFGGLSTLDLFGTRGWAISTINQHTTRRVASKASNLQLAVEGVSACIGVMTDGARKNPKFSVCNQLCSDLRLIYDHIENLNDDGKGQAFAPLLPPLRRFLEERDQQLLAQALTDPKLQGARQRHVLETIKARAFVGLQHSNYKGDVASPARFTAEGPPLTPLQAPRAGRRFHWNTAVPRIPETIQLEGLRERLVQNIEPGGTFNHIVATVCDRIDELEPRHGLGRADAEMVTRCVQHLMDAPALNTLDCVTRVRLHQTLRVLANALQYPKLVEVAIFTEAAMMPRGVFVGVKPERLGKALLTPEPAGTFLVGARLRKQPEFFVSMCEAGKPDAEKVSTRLIRGRVGGDGRAAWSLEGSTAKYASVAELVQKEYIDKGHSQKIPSQNQNAGGSWQPRPNNAVKGARSVGLRADGKLLRLSAVYTQRGTTYHQVNSQNHGAAGKVHPTVDDRGNRRMLKVLRSEYAPLPPRGGKNVTRVTDIDKIENEINVLRAAKSRVAPLDMFSINGKVSLVLPAMAGDAGDVVPKVPLGHRPQVVRWMGKELARDLVNCHDAGFLHCDIKPDNVLISNVGEAVLADYGLAQRQDLATRISGTSGFLAPEYLAGKSATRAIDIWSLGVTLCETLLGSRVFYGATDDANFDPLPEGQRHEIFAAWYASCLDASGNFDSNLMYTVTGPHVGVFQRYFAKIMLADVHLGTYILKNMLHPEPAHRPTAEAVFQAMEALQRTDSPEENLAKRAFQTAGADPARESIYRVLETKHLAANLARVKHVSPLQSVLGTI